MNQSSIKIDVLLDPNKVPQQISWSATDSSNDMAQKAKAMCIAFWDGADKTALRIDLWTKDMMVDELKVIIEKIINETGAGSPADMGRIIGIANKQLAGKADGKTIAAAVKDLLTHIP